MSSTIQKWRALTDDALAKYRSGIAAVAAEQVQLEETKAAHAGAQEASCIAQQISQDIQEQAHARIARIVTRCLQVVFDDPYTFEIKFERKRGKTEAVLAFMRNGVAYNPTASTGGGVVNVAAFALRLAAIMLATPPSRRLLVLDEPFCHVHGKENRARVRAMVLQLAEEMGVQFLIATGIEDFVCGTVIELE